MTLFVEFIRTSFYVNMYIILLIIFRRYLINKYDYKFNYTIYLLIILKLLIITKIYVYIPISPKLLNTNNSMSNQINIQNDNHILILFYFWLIVCVINIFCKVYYNVKVYKYINNLKTKVYDKNIINSLERQKKCMNVNSDIEIFTLECVHTPMIIGLRNSKIIIPKREYKTYELDFIFKHELIHYIRKDNYIKLILDVVGVIHWFNPFVYIFKRFFYEYCELSCDELVIKGCKLEEIKCYSLLLLDTMKYKNKLSLSMYSSQFNMNKSNKLKRRVKNMFELRHKKKGVLLATICSVVAIMSILSFKVYAYNSTDDVDNVNLIRAVGTNNLTGYVKKSDLYNVNQPQETLDQVMLYMETKQDKRVIPLYDAKGNIIGEYLID